jgi:metal-responsive CopG/Arc/MetJ family transcriptional regulator
MAMAKVNVSLPDGLLNDVDELATQLKRSRSGIVQEATALYVARLREERAEAERRESIRGARKGMAKLAGELEPFDAATAIRADRDRDGRKAGER